MVVWDLIGIVWLDLNSKSGMICSRILSMLRLNVVVCILHERNPLREHGAYPVIFVIWVVAMLVSPIAPKVVVTDLPAFAVHQELFACWIHWVS